MSEINHAQEVRDVLEFYKKHGRRLPNGEHWRVRTCGDVTIKPAMMYEADSYDLDIDADLALDLLTMDLMRWRREIKTNRKFVYPTGDAADFVRTLGIEIDCGQGECEMYWEREGFMPHRALMAAIEEQA